MSGGSGWPNNFTLFARCLISSEQTCVNGVVVLTCSTSALLGRTAVRHGARYCTRREKTTNHNNAKAFAPPNRKTARATHRRAAERNGQWGVWLTEGDDDRAHRNAFGPPEIFIYRRNTVPQAPHNSLLRRIFKRRDICATPPVLFKTAAAVTRRWARSVMTNDSSLRFGWSAPGSRPRSHGPVIEATVLVQFDAGRPAHALSSALPEGDERDSGQEDQGHRQHSHEVDSSRALDTEVFET